MKMILMGVMGVFLAWAGPAAALDSVRIISPSSGAVISEKSVTISVTVTGSVKSVACNIYKKDGWWPVEMLSRDNAGPFQFTWDTTRSIYPNGQYTIWVWGYSSSTSTKSLASASVTVTVKNDSTAPIVSISNPSQQQVISGVFNVSANASDDIGVANVQFKLDGQNLGTADTASPYEVSWDTTYAIGPHSASAVATDTSGKQTTSTNVSFQVKDVTNPSVLWTGPSAGQVPDGNLTLSADAADNDRILKVEFYDDTVLLGSDFDLPYSMAVVLTTGTHSLSAKSYDLIGNSSQTSPVIVTVQIPDTTPPTVQITQPPSGALPFGALIYGQALIAATASDNVAVDHVDFVLRIKSGNDLFFSVTDSLSPYEFTFKSTTVNDATYLLEARAYDTAGNIGRHFRTLTVDNTGPSVSISAPVAGAAVSGNSVLYSVTASDITGVSSVEFLAGGITLGIDNTSPYELSWDTTSNQGNVTLSAKAYDSPGNQTSSQPVTVNVDNEVIPPVTFDDGWDWSLPADVQSGPRSGMFLMACNNYSIDTAAPPESLKDLLKIRGKTIYWSKLHTGDGQFDFSEITNDLADAHAKGYQIVFRLKSNETGNDNSFGDGFSHVPVWIISKYASTNPILSAYMLGSLGASKFIKVAAVWNGFDSGETAQNPGAHPGLHDEYLKFVKRFGEQGFQNNTAFAGIYLTGYSASYGEEMVISPENYSNLRNIGMDELAINPAASNFVKVFNARMDAWALAFGDRKYKVIWTGAILFGTSSVWTGEPGHLMNQHAFDVGLGIRGGALEEPFANVFTPYPYHDYGTLLVNGSTSKDGYLRGNWDWVVNKEKRFHGEENEAFGDFSEYEGVMYRNAMLMALLRGVNYLWTDKKIIEFDLPLSEYYAKEAGKGPDEIYDAWVFLRESEQRLGSLSNYKIKNFEHWLHQREIETAKTVRAKFTLRNGTNRDCDIPDVDDEDPRNGEYDRGDFLARRTDLATGQSEIRIYVDDKFMKMPQADNVTLKVTYTDDGGEWYIRYCTNNGIKSSAHVVESDSGLERTVTFILPNFTPSKAITGGFDLALIAEGQDLTASFIRLIKTRPNVEVQS